jgi:tetratricopeptide (TPR) repeat protein
MDADAEDHLLDDAQRRITEVLGANRPIADARAIAHELTQELPERPESWLTVAETHLWDDDAITRQSVERAIRLAPDDPDILLRAADVLVHSKAEEEAMEILRRVKPAVNPEDAERVALMLELAGMVHHHRGDRPSAERALKHAVAVGPPSVRHALALAAFYRDDRRSEDARRVLIDALGRAPANPALLEELQALELTAGRRTTGSNTSQGAASGAPGRADAGRIAPAGRIASVPPGRGGR